METELPKKYTHSAIIEYVAEANNIKKKEAKEIIESYLYAVEKGMLDENRVPVGNFGKIYMHLKPASKERQGINPATGQTITISAKPASRVPKFGFNKAFKETVKNSG